MLPAVSVVIPTFNRAALVTRALASVEAQSRQPAEVIVVDDGSTDTTADVIAERFPAVTTLRQSQAGVSAARNRGIEAASGEWIALLDSDDEWLPPKLERQLAALHAAPSYRFCHTEELWIRRGRRVNPAAKHAKRGGHIFRHCLPLCAISPSSALIHRELLREVGLFNPELPACEDYELWLRICARHPVLFVDEPLVVKHGGHDDQLSRRHWGMDRFRVQALESVLDSTVLGEEDRRAAVGMLLEKIEIYLQGAQKRAKWDEVASYRAKRERWRGAA